MGLGALEALRAAKLNKKILSLGIDGTSEAIQAIVDGEFAGTVVNDPMWQGGMGLALAYQAKNGVFDPAKEPHEHREFYFTPVFVGRTMPWKSSRTTSTASRSTRGTTSGVASRRRVEVVFPSFRL